jgi:hypothetical protein
MLKKTNKNKILEFKRKMNLKMMLICNENKKKEFLMFI